MCLAPAFQNTFKHFKIMKIELKNVKYAAFASEETNCFNAVIWVDGKKEGTARNEGRGGNTHIAPFSLADKLNAYAKTLPLKVTTLENDDGSAFTFQPDAETIIDDLLEDHLQAKKLKRLCASKTLFRVKGETYAEGEYMVMKVKFTPEIKAKLIAKYSGGITFLNDEIAGN